MSRLHLFAWSTLSTLFVARGCGWLIGWGLLCVGAGGCGRHSLEREAAAAAKVPGAAAVRFLGEVHVIGTDGRFVLVEAPSTMAVTGLTDGQTLVCRTAGTDAAILHVSHERRPPFVVADVVSGVPHVGDEVYVVPGSEPVAKPAATPSLAPPFRADPLLPAVP